MRNIRRDHPHRLTVQKPGLTREYWPEARNALKAESRINVDITRHFMT
jgi:hypothetical protein